ncbi:MAG: glycosyltransferase family 4 protein [Chitinophagales bacterium]|nr:glycosyltransferase family 4 protein [Chitinophagales bacterium]
MKVLLVRRNWAHHSNKSGYDYLFNFLNDSYFKAIFLSYKKNYFAEALHKLLQPFCKVLKNDYRVDWFFKELKIAIQIILYKPDIVHFNHFDQKQILLSKKYFQKKTKFVGTCHYPVSFFKMKYFSAQDFSHANTLICLDKYSASWFADKVKNSVYIPHAVETNYFVPDYSKKEKNFKCFFAGRFIRDWDNLYNIITLCNKKKLPVQFHILHPKILNPLNDWYKMIGLLSYENVHYYEYVSDEAFLHFYQSSDVLLMPLFDSTANNVILEAMSCGLPIITNKTSGIVSYLDENIAYLHEPNDVENMVHSIEYLLNNPDKKNEMGKLAREKTITNFSIEVVANQLKNLYKQVQQQ